MVVSRQEALDFSRVDELDHYLDRQLEADLFALHRAATHLRVMGLFGLAGWAAILCLFGVVLMVAPGRWPLAELLLFLGFLSGVLVGMAAFYFFLANHVSAGRRWAVAVALGLAVLVMANCLLSLLKTRNVALVVFDSFFLIAHLNLLKALTQSWLATGRLQRFIETPLARRLLEGTMDAHVEVGPRVGS